jgi:hypothetical protein
MRQGIEIRRGDPMSVVVGQLAGTVQSSGARLVNPSRPISGVNDTYLAVLAMVLAGYALAGKGFAYLGVPPIFIGELTFVAGIFIFLRAGCFVASLATLPSLLLAALMVWVGLQTVPYVGQFGLDCLRDSVVIMYGGFAFIVIALMLENDKRMEVILGYYSKFVGIFIPFIPFIFAASHYAREAFPKWPNSGVPILWVQSGEVAVHLAGATIFVLAGFRRVPTYWVLFVLATLILVVPLSRGAMLAFVVPVALSALLLGKIREITTVAAIGCVLFGMAFAVETAVTERREAYSSDERLTSTRQVVDNVVSLFGSSNEQAEGTKKWRLDWWNLIIDNTLFGTYFWTGRGFGLNIADADGFRPDRGSIHPLRSPHNVHMTLLARAGVPGVTLWFLLLVSWFGLLFRGMRQAQIRNHTAWASLFVFVSCYGMAAVINATFDPALEGPMQGIWFWCLYGFGVGTLMVYSANPIAMSVQANEQKVHDTSISECRS